MKLLTTVLAILLLGVCNGAAAPKQANGFSKKLVGTWLGPRRYYIFHADGQWGLLRNLEDQEEQENIMGRRWHIKGNKLVLTFPHDPKKGTMYTNVYHIVSLTSEELITETGGYEAAYKRIH